MIGDPLSRGEEGPNVINLSSRDPAMVRLTDELERRRLERLVPQLMDELQTYRSVTHGTDHVGDVDLWRKAARAAGRRLGMQVRTGVSRDGMKVWASEGP
jgi:hypothetical protein